MNYSPTLAALLLLATTAAAQLQQVPGTNLFYDPGRAFLAVGATPGELVVAWPDGYAAPFELRLPQGTEREITMVVTQVAYLARPGSCLAQLTDLGLAVAWDSWSQPYGTNASVALTAPPFMVSHYLTAWSTTLTPFTAQTQSPSLMFRAWTGIPWTSCVNPRLDVAWTIMRVTIHG
jgi:hypothetical protein